MCDIALRWKWFNAEKMASIMSTAIRYGLLFLLILFWGCQSSTMETEEEEKPFLTPVSLQLQWVTQTQFAGYYVALEKGWYKAEGLDVTIYPGGPDIVAVDLVTSRTRDFGTTLLADLIVSIGKGKSAISIAQIQQNNGLRLLTRRSLNIQSPADFIGKKVGVWLGGWEVQFNALLAQHQISPGSVDQVSQGFSMHPFLDGRLDVASAMIYNEYNMVLAAGLKADQLHLIDYADYNLNFPGDVLFTTRTLVETKPELCRKMVRASFRGWQYAIDHMDEAVDIVLKHDRSGVSTKVHQKKMMTRIAELVEGSANAPLGRLDPESFNKMADLLIQYEMLQSPLNINDVYTPEFIHALTP